MRDITDLIGRIFVSIIFFFEVYDSIAFKSDTIEKMQISGLSWNTEILYFGGLFILILGSILVFLGYRSTLGALLLLLYWVPVTIITHDFWNIKDIYEWRMEGSIFMKNMAIVGALLLIMAHGSGKYSVRRFLATTRVNNW